MVAFRFNMMVLSLCHSVYAREFTVSCYFMHKGVFGSLTLYTEREFLVSCHFIHRGLWFPDALHCKGVSIVSCYFTHKGVFLLVFVLVS